MKRKVISVLALTLIVLMSAVLVSCEDMLPIADPEIVNAVVYETEMEMSTFNEYIEELIDGVKTPGVLEALITSKLNTKYDTDNADVDADSSSISASASGDKLGVSAKFTSLRKETAAYKGDFSVESTFNYKGATHNIKIKGYFIDENITFDSVNYNGTDYDVDAFNRAIN